MTIDHLFIDLDNTILDFYAAEADVLGRALAAHGIDPTPETTARYCAINLEQWHLLEQGAISIDEVGVRRFALLVEALGCGVDPVALAATYEGMLGACCHFMPGAQALLETLAPRYPLYLVTNGMANVQYARIANCGLDRYFTQLFISSDLGAVKPDAAFFDGCFAQIPSFDRSRAVILGDGLGSDIRGGLQAGLRTIWYNPRRQPNTTPWQPHVEVADLAQVPAVLKAWEMEVIT